jgi:hypothetical protein
MINVITVSMYVYDCRLKINHESHWAYAFILEFSTVANKISCIQVKDTIVTCTVYS